MTSARSSSPRGSRRHSVARLSKGRIDREERVLGGGADEDHEPLLHRREQGVLLRLVEPVDLVDEEDGAPALLAEQAPGLVDARRGRRPRPAFTADRGTKVLAVVAATTWARVVLPVPAGPHRMAEVRRSASMRTRSGRVGRHQVALADDVVEGPGPQPGRQRGALAQPVGGRLGEEVGWPRAPVDAVAGSPSVSASRLPRAGLSRPRG